ncbi:uroporphyrinogen-III C-methyltransferase [Marinobacterium mangrovicola]|uniref:Uroporphyrin-3 C-methyltransferase n=1 Tax=Marinobacterium mangrovicola TaxID=1476959 RepID=A0A4R1GGK4_9GAMM|nr:uroporphyrinogen-III C-methyltransferase [Marinobacterium mangrovicola]TCK06050.1 uroporphyrin-3 C-methyltransferase [Marinobacterium mangrovicola]
MNDTRKPEEQTLATESKTEEQTSAAENTTASDSSSDKPTVSATTPSTDSNKATDSEPSASAAAGGDAGGSGTQPPASEPKKPATWPGKLALLLSVISLGGVGYLCWQGWELKQSTTNSQGAIAQQVETELANTRAQIADRVSGVSETLGALKSQAESDKQNIAQLQQRLTDAIKQVNATRETSREDFLLAEAEYLLRLANQRVLMEQTATGALTLLKSTDQILRESDDVALYPVREALAQDIAALEAVPSLDTEGIYLQLAALSSQVDNLRVTPITDKRKLPAMLEEITPESVEQSWTEGAAAAWGKAVDKFEKLVVIQHRDEPVEPLMSPEQTYYLQQNLHLMLEQAQLALLQRKQLAFDASLLKANDWVSTYFDEKDATTESLLRAFAELKQIDVAPELPDISGSLKALKAHLSEMARLKQEANR